jgi:DNA-binding CsgD family transcriptional regulator
VGRDEELAVAREVLTGESAGIVISGAPGVGKTRVADELASELSAATEGAGPSRVVRMVATRAAATIPFGAAAVLLEDAVPPTLPVDPENVTAARQAILDRLPHRAPGSGNGSRLVVSVDDAHLLDEASAQLVYHLAHSGEVRLIVTVRSAEVAPGTIDALWQEGLCRRLELQPLSRDEVVQLLQVALDGQVEQHSADNLWRVTAGNVLFLRELCRDAQERGQLVQRHGVWHWAATPLLVGARLQELLDARVGQLADDVHEAAALLALGEPLPRSLLGELAGQAAVAELDDRGLLDATNDGSSSSETAPDPSVRLSHPLYAEGLRGRLGPLETADLYAQLADGLAARPTVTDDDRLRIAVWSVTSGRPVPAPLLATAGRAALERGDAALAERLARAAQPEPAAALVLGEALAALRRNEEAEAVLAPLQHVEPGPDQRAGADDADRSPDASAGPEPDPRALSWRTRVAVARLVAHRSPLLPLDTARELTAAVRASVDPAERDLVDAALADTLGYRRRPAEAGELAWRVLRSPNAAARAMALGPAVVWLVSTGRAEEAVTAGRAVLTDVLARPDQLPTTPTGVLSSLATALLAAGRLDDVVELCDTAESLPVDQPGRSEGTIALMRGLTALLRGRPESARQELGMAVLSFERVGASGHQAFALASLAEAKALMGDVDIAVQTWDTLPQALRDDPPLDWRRSETWVELVRRGDARLAAQHATDGADQARAAGAPFFEMILAYTALQMGALDQAPRVAALASDMQGPLAEALSAHADALTRNDATALEHVAAHFEQIGFRLFAAEAAVHAALAHRRAGSSSRARTASTRAATLRAGCEGARTPVLAQAAMVADLTEREREVALLAARGMTSRQIADRLGISVRTVDNQLGRVYTKLGVTGRRDLATAVDQLDG